MATENYWVYVLRNPVGKSYIGLTDDVILRLEQHNSGVSKWTKKHRPWEVIWQKGPMPLTEARKLENWLKHQRGGNGFYTFTGLQPGSSSGS
jgi:putative endonuclease